MKKLKRVCIYPKDIQRITGKSERYGRKLLQEIRLYFDKKPNQFVTTKEFSEYSGINESTVEEFLVD